MTALLLLAVLGAEVPALALKATDGKTYELQSYVAMSKYTVVIFYANDCPVVRGHGARIKELAGKYAESGVKLLMVDSEASASLERDAKAAAEREYPFPVLIDSDGAVAKALGIQFASTAVVFDQSGKVRYRGGIDSDRAKLRDSAERYLADALDALVAGREPKLTETKTLGCLLRFK